MSPLFGAMTHYKLDSQCVFYGLSGSWALPCEPAACHKSISRCFPLTNCCAKDNFKFDRQYDVYFSRMQPLQEMFAFLENI